MYKLFLSFLLSTSFCFSQTSITISGLVHTQENEPLEAEITVNQLVGDTWEYRAEGNTDSNGEFSIPVNNITSVTDAGLSSLNYSLNGSTLYSPVKTEAEIIDYNLLGEEVSRQKIELISGSNELKADLNNLANEIDREANIVTIICDSGYKYFSTIYNDEWLKENDLL